MAKKINVKCYLCETELVRKETEPAPAICPACGTNLVSPGNETQRYLVRCNYAKSFFSVWQGVMVLSNKRLIWVKTATSAAQMGGGLVGVLAAKAANKDAGQAQMNLNLEDIDRLDNHRRGLMGGVAVHTKDGRVFKFLGGFSGKKLRYLREKLGR